MLISDNIVSILMCCITRARLVASVWVVGGYILALQFFVHSLYQKIDFLRSMYTQKYMHYTSTFIGARFVTCRKYSFSLQNSSFFARFLQTLHRRFVVPCVRLTCKRDSYRIRLLHGKERRGGAYRRIRQEFYKKSTEAEFMVWRRDCKGLDGASRIFLIADSPKFCVYA